MACKPCLEKRRKAFARMGTAGRKLAKVFLPADMQPDFLPQPAATVAPEPMPAELIPAQRLIDEARALVGTRFLHQGRNAAGVDCVGFAGLAAMRAGLNVAALFGEDWQITNYPKTSTPHLLHAMETRGRRINEPVPGCAILFKWQSSEFAQHFAVYTERATIIHAVMRRRQVVEHGYREQWLELTHSMWLLPGIDYGTAY